MKTYLVIYSNGCTEFYNNIESFFDLIGDLKHYCILNEVAVNQVIKL